MYRILKSHLAFALTCFEAQLVLLLAFVVVQRPHFHTFVRVVEGVQPSVGVIGQVLGDLVLFQPFVGGCVPLVAADTEQPHVSGWDIEFSWCRQTKC